MSVTEGLPVDSERGRLATDESRADRKTIALIDDDLPWVETVSGVLRAEDFDVYSARSPEDALDLLDSAQPDLIILDVHIQGTSGLRILTDYRGQDCTTPVLVVSADDGALVRNQAMNMGASGFLQKPITSKLLVRAIRRCLKFVLDNSVDNCADDIGEEQIANVQG